MTKVTINIPDEVWQWLKERGDATAQIMAALHGHYGELLPRHDKRKRGGQPGNKNAASRPASDTQDNQEG